MDKTQYKDIFVFIEQREGMVSPVSFELLGKAKDLASVTGEKVAAVLMGYKTDDVARQCFAYGADMVYRVDAPQLEVYTTEPYTQAFNKIVADKLPSVILIGATTIGRDLGPRLSARLGTGLTADCTGLDIGEDNNLMMTRPAFGGNLMATIVCKDHRPQMSTVRPGVMRVGQPDNDRTGTIEDIKVNFDESKFRVRVTETVSQKKDLVDITEASILVSGGRGVGNAEGFAVLGELASEIGAEVSSSRAMVDAGVMDHSRQVGQTGKTVRPDIYFACGISGAIQHLAGMEESDFIIAINKDALAPIFQTADLGLVGDVNKIVPALTNKLRRIRENKA